MTAPPPLMLALAITRNGEANNWTISQYDKYETSTVREDLIGFMVGRISNIELSSNKRDDSNKHSNAIMVYNLRGGRNSYVDLWGSDIVR